MNTELIKSYLASADNLDTAMASIQYAYVKQRNSTEKGIVTTLPFPTGIGKTHSCASVMTLNLVDAHEYRLRKEEELKELGEEPEFEVISKNKTKTVFRTLFTAPSVELVKEQYKAIHARLNSIHSLNYIDEKTRDTLLKRVVKMDTKHKTAERFIEEYTNVHATFRKVFSKGDLDFVSGTPIWRTFTSTLSEASKKQKELKSVRADMEHNSFRQDALLKRILKERFIKLEQETSPLFNKCFNEYSKVLEAIILATKQTQKKYIPKILDLIEKDSFLREIYPDTLLSWGRVDVVIATAHKCTYEPKVFLGGRQNFFYGGDIVKYCGNIFIDEWDKTKSIINNILFNQVSTIDNLRSVHILLSQLELQNTLTEDLIEEYDDQGVSIQLQEEIQKKLPAQFQSDEFVVERLSLLIQNCREFYNNSHSSYPLVAPTMPSQMPYASDLSTFHIYSAKDSVSLNRYITINDHEEMRTEIAVANSTERVRFGNTLIELISALENHMVYEITIYLRSILDHIRLNYENLTHQQDGDLLNYLFTNLGFRSHQRGIIDWLATAMTYNPQRGRDRVKKGTDPYRNLMVVMEIGELVDQSIDVARDSERAISMLQASECAETFIMKATDLNNIIGLSATALVPGYLSNFDAEWIASVIGDRMLQPTEEQIDLAFEVYQNERRFAENKIEIKCRSAKKDKDYVAALKEKILSKSECSLAEDETYGDTDLTSAVYYGALENKFGYGVNDHHIERMSKLIKATEEFFTNVESDAHGTVKSRSMLCFLNGRVSQALQPVVREVIEKVGSKFDKKPIITFLYADTYDSLERGVCPTEENPIIYISTYNSAGTGVNLQFRKHKDIRGLIYIGSEARLEGANAFDIDSIYLEKPTVVGFPNMHAARESSDRKERDTIRYSAIHSVNVLRQKNEITSEVAKQMGKQCLTLGINGDPKSYTDTEDYENSVFRIIRQAIGRCGRTAWRLPVIKITIDDELAWILRNDDFSVVANAEMKRKTCAYEYQKLIEFCQTKNSFKLQTQISRAQRRKENRRVSACHDSRKDLLSFIRRNRRTEAKQEQYIADYDELRLSLLRNPTLQPGEPEEFKTYITFDAPTADYEFDYDVGYWAGSESDFRQKRSSVDYFDATKFAFDPSARQTANLPNTARVGMAETPLPALMQNLQLREYFQQQGFATQWLPGTRILNPIWFPAYKGALGEEIFRYAVTDNNLGEFRDIPVDHFERYDFNLEGIAIDVKSWSDTFQERIPAEQMVETAHQRLEQTGMDRFVYVNVMSFEGSVPVTDISSHDDRVSFVSGLFDRRTGKINTNALLAMENVIKRWRK